MFLIWCSSAQDLCGSMSPLKLKKVHMCMCAQGEPLSQSPAFRRFMTADQMMLIMFADARTASGLPLASSTFRRGPDTPALPSIWAKTHRGSLTLSQEHVMEQQATVSQFRVQISVPAPPSRPDLPEFGHTQELNSACPCG